MDTYVEALKTAGLRVTAPRLAVLGVVAEHPHAKAEEVAGMVRERLGAVSKQAIYDVLHALSEVGILRQVIVDGRKSQYELETGDNHHHVYCAVCGHMEDVPCHNPPAPCMLPPVETGFEFHSADVVYRGRCRECQASSQQDS